MAKQIKNLRHNSKFTGGMIDGRMRIDLLRFGDNLQRAQYLLDSMVMDSMVPYMPMRMSTFVDVTRGMSQAIAGSGKVVAAASPMGRFLYEGKVMVGEQTRSAYAAKGEKKVVTAKNLQYSRFAHPAVTDHWFDTTKKYHGKTWIRKTKQVAGGG